MEKSKLCPELQTILNQFAQFRNKYMTLMAESMVHTELLQLQKMELAKMTARTDQLSTALISYQRCCVKLRRLESENQRLQAMLVVQNDTDNDHIPELNGNKDKHVCSFQDDLIVLRSKIDSQSMKHQEEIDSMKKQCEEEIVLYKKKLEYYSTLEQRHSDEISRYKRMLEELKSKAEKTIPSIKKNVVYSHPAFEDNVEPNKRKKSAPSAFKWPQLDIAVVKNESTVNQQSTRRKKKLYQADNDAIVHIPL